MSKRKKLKLSPRHVFANRLAKLSREQSLNPTATAELVELDGRKFYQVDFKKGKANVYGEDFIQFDFAGKQPVYDTVGNAMKYFKIGILAGKTVDADKIPQKPLDKDE